MVLRTLVTATAAVVLLAGCSGGDDNKSADSKDSANQTPGTPSAPAVTPYDPPKAFQGNYAYSLPEVKGHTFAPLVGMVGMTAVANSLRGVAGQSAAGPAKPWQTPATETTDGSVVINDATAPFSVQLDGKPAVAVAYYQRVKGAGTAKPGLSVLFRWLDPADGKLLSEATVDATALLGDDEVNSGSPGDFRQVSVDPATGQMAVGLGPSSMIGAKSGIITVIGDPATKKGVAVPFTEPAGISKGVLVAVQGKPDARQTVSLLDAATGRVTKSGLLPGLENLNATGSNGGKYAYLYGLKYDKSITENVGYLYAVDPATGAVVQTKSALKRGDYLARYKCQADGQKSVVCTADQVATGEIIGFDDTTGKKAWGFTGDSTGRVVPTVTAAFHGMVYATVSQKPILLNALTGQDVPVPTPTIPTGPDTGGPTPGETATQNPSDGSTDGSTPSGDSSGAPVVAQPDYKLQSPTSVSEYGGAYLTEAEYGDGFSGTLQILKAVG